MSDAELTDDGRKMVREYERQFQVTAPCGMWIAAYEMLAAECAHPHHGAGYPDGYKMLLSNLAYKIYGYFPEEVRKVLTYKPSNLPTVQ